LKEVNKVILGASCLLSNGSMLAPAGTAMVAALAKQKQIPVIVASESYKFSDKVQLDSIVFNELGHANEIVTVIPANKSTQAIDNEVFSTSIQPNPNDANSTYTIAPQREPGYRGSSDKLSLRHAGNVEAVSTQQDNSEYISVPNQANNYTNTSSLSTVKLPFEVINMRYDLTPLNNISVIATETGLIPPTSVPVLIREIQSDLAYYSNK
jgi:translation initiation factor eIF-2B subunit delta